MTYCIGWKAHNTVFLISDSAVTVQSNNLNTDKLKSSFDEETIDRPDKFVFEGIHKQFKIGDNLIITYAGDIKTALYIISLTKKYFNKENPISSFLLALDAIRDPLRPTNVTFIIGLKEREKIKLFSYNILGNGELKEEDNLIQIGSLSNTEYNRYKLDFYNNHIKLLERPEEQFYQFLTFLQHFGIHDKTFNYFAGGIYNGILINNYGSCWMDDIAYIIYKRKITNDDKFQILGRVNCFIRYDCLVVSSSFTNQREFFINSEDNIIYQSVELQKHIATEHYLIKPKIFSFLASDKRIIATIKTNGINSNIHFTDEKIGGKQVMRLNNDFIKMLNGEYFKGIAPCYIYWDNI